MEPRKPPVNLRAALFDLDGTVADTHGLIQQCYDHALRTHLNQPAVPAIWREHVGLPLDDILIATYKYYRQSLSPDHLEEVKRTYREHMRAHRHTVRPFPGIPELLHSFCSYGVRLAIVTTKHRAMAEHHLETMGLSDLFTALVAGDECRYCKPHPEPFLKALQALEVGADQAIAIGDSRNDILGAHAAQVYSVGAAWGTDNLPALRDARPDFLVETPQALLPMTLQESE